MACAHCGAEMAASQRARLRRGHSGSAVTAAGAEGALTSLTAATETPTPLPDRSSEHDESLTVPPVSHAEPDTHMRPAVIAGDQPSRGATGRIAESGLRDRHLPDRHAIRPALPPRFASWGLAAMAAFHQAWHEELAVVVAISGDPPGGHGRPRGGTRPLEKQLQARAAARAGTSRTRTSCASTTSGKSRAARSIDVTYVHGAGPRVVPGARRKASRPRALDRAPDGVGTGRRRRRRLVHRDLKPAEYPAGRRRTD